jgi:serine/threonine-protein kinase HipA
MAGRPSKSRMLDVWMNGELVGRWTFSATKGHSFAYDPTWLASSHARPLTLSMPLSLGTSSIAGEKVENYFDNLLPDSLDIRKRVASKFSATSTKAFELLEKIGRDCVGAVQLLPPDSPRPDVRRIDAEPLSENDVENILDNTVTGRSIGVPEDDALRISIAGAQEKTALLWHQGNWCRPLGMTPTTHILKLPLGDVGGQRADFSTSVENEWLCSRIVKAFGLDAAECEIQNFGRHKTLVVTRFDRLHLDSWWARLPQEDFCQVLGLSSESKYEQRNGPGMAAILEKLRGSAKADLDRKNFLAIQLLFWLLAAPDGHAKNFSIFLQQEGRYCLTPFYDVMSAWPVIGDEPRKFQWHKVKMAMAVRSKNAHYRMIDIQRRHWNAVAKQNAVGPDFEEVIQQFIDIASRAISAVSAELPKEFPAQVCDPIFEGILRQVRQLQNQQG